MATRREEKSGFKSNWSRMTHDFALDKEVPNVVGQKRPLVISKVLYLAKHQLHQSK